MILSVLSFQPMIWGDDFCFNLLKAAKPSAEMNNVGWSSSVLWCFSSCTVTLLSDVVMSHAVGCRHLPLRPVCMMMVMVMMVLVMPTIYVVGFDDDNDNGDGDDDGDADG